MVIDASFGIIYNFISNSACNPKQSFNILGFPEKTSFPIRTY